jgi:hypothetical protein
MIPVQAAQLRPRSAFILLSLIPVVCLFYVAVVTSNHNRGVWIAAILLSAIPILIYFVQRKSYVVIDNDGFTYKTLAGAQSIRWKNVSRSYLKMKFTGKSSERRWHFENKNGGCISFPTGSYNRRSLRTIAEALITKCSAADIAPRITEKGKVSMEYLVNAEREKQPIFILTSDLLFSYDPQQYGHFALVDIKRQRIQEFFRNHWAPFTVA